MKIVIYALMLILLSSFALATFSNTTVYNVSGTYNYTVPAGVTRINVSVWGAGGGGGGGGTGSGSIGGAGGGGAFSNGLLSVTPGETLFIMVGSGGAKGNFSTGTSGALTGDGAGGGAWSALNRSTTPLIIAAGGGGGGGGDNADSAAGGAGGAGGAALGANGSNSGTSTGGKGASLTSGGAGGVSSATDDGANGTAYQGGNGGNPTGASCAGDSVAKVQGGIPGGGGGGLSDVGSTGGCAGGAGGGGGYFGGGGGAGSSPSDAGGAGGGGGSSLVAGIINITTAGSGRNAANNLSCCYLNYSNKAGFGGSGGAVNGNGTAGNPGLVVILANFDPVISGVLINSTFGTNLTTENLTAFWNASDDDGDVVRNVTCWSVNGISNNIIFYPFMSSNNLNMSIGVRDYSGNGYRGNVTNAVWNATGGYDGRGAYTFKAGSYITAGDVGDESANMTITAWVYGTNFSSDSSNINTIVAKETSDGGSSFILRVGDSGIPINMIQWTINQNNGAKMKLNGGLLNTNTWYFIAATYNSNGSIRLFINGVLSNETVFDGTLRNDTSILEIGRSLTNNDRSWIGNLDEVQIFKRSLTQAQILLLYQNMTNKIHSDETTTGENWSVCITPNDGFGDGNISCSTNLTIKDVPLTLFNTSIIDFGTSVILTGSQTREAKVTSIGNDFNISLFCVSGNCTAFSSNWTNGTNMTTGQSITTSFTCLNSSLGSFEAVYNLTSTNNLFYGVQQINLTCAFTAPTFALDISFPGNNSLHGFGNIGYVTLNTTSLYSFPLNCNVSWNNIFTASGAMTSQGGLILSNTSVSDGNYTITASCADAYGSVKNASVNVLYSSLPPFFTNVYPANNSNVSFNSTLFGWNANNSLTDYPANCSMFIDGALFYFNDSDSWGAHSFVKDFVVGLHNWSVACLDAAKNSGSTETLYFTILECDHALISPCDECKYRQRNVTLATSCIDTDSATLFYEFNHYSPVLWAGGNVTLTSNFGRNTICLYSNTSAKTCRTFYSANEGETSSAFIIIFVMLIIACVCSISTNSTISLIGGVLFMACGLMFYAWTWIMSLVTVFIGIVVIGLSIRKN